MRNIVDLLGEPTALHAALEAASRGWSVFPIIPGTKRPLIPWRDFSSNSRDQIEDWNNRYPNCNWGVDCGKSNLLVIDVDNKHGVNGAKSLAQIEVEAGKLLPSTLTVTTPSGGKHFYFEGRAKSKNGWAEGLDVKSEGGYVVLYGSEVDLGTYWLSQPTAVACAPEWIIHKLGKRTERAPNAEQWLTDPDLAHNVEWAINFLQNQAPDSVEGQNGDDTLVKCVLFPLRDHGISEETAVELILENYNDTKAFPSWTESELRIKAGNAYRYAQSPAGSRTPEGLATTAATAFAEFPAPTGVSVPAAPVDPAGLNIPLIDVQTIDEPNLPKRRWLLGRRLLRGYITGTFSPGGVGKSNLTYLEALSVATGRDLCGEQVHQTGPVVLFNAEDSADELKMRFAAVCRHYGISLCDFDGQPRPDGKIYHRVYLLSGRDLKLRVVGPSNNGKLYVPDETAVATLREMVRRTGAVLFVGDPFVRLHDAPENDNVAIDKVAEVFSDLAHSLDVSVHLVHHTRKRSGSGGEGDAEQSRGASSFVNAMRLAHTLTAMDEESATTFGVPADMARWYVRLDDAKINLAPPADCIRWFKKIDVVLANGEHVGTLERVNLAAVKKLAQTGHPPEIERLISLMASRVGTGPCQLADLGSNIKILMNETLRSPRQITDQIAQYFQKRSGNAIMANGLVIKLVKSGTGRWLVEATDPIRS